MLFDTHAHYNDARFDEDRDEILSSMKENNVELIMNACSNLGEMEEILAITEKYDFIYAACGIHPHDAENAREADMDKIREYARLDKIKAIGEIGLDYFYDFCPKELQKKWFARQVELAKEIKMPIMIHDRDAHKDTLDILRALDIRDIGGVFHCYSGSAQMAKEILDWGMYIAFGGSLTFKNARRTVEAAQYVPLDRIVIETDSPYLAPVPMRGKRNSSLYIHFVAEKLAQIKKVSVDEIERVTMENGKRCFGVL